MSYPQGPGQPGENPYPQYPGGPAQPSAPQYPQPQYPPTPAYPPQYAQPQAQPPYPGQYSPPAVPAKESNAYASQALISGVVLLVITIVALILGRVLIGVLAIYVIYVGARGLITAFGLRTHAGLISSIFGLFFGILSLLITLLGLGAFDSILIPLLGG
ncbi:MAG TPA: hypothetical protein VH349_16130 [Ktedonobacterales bacterium]